jgi:hypothetical protein
MNAGEDSFGFKARDLARLRALLIADTGLAFF